MPEAAVRIVVVFKEVPHADQVESLAADFEHIAKSTRRNQPGHGAATFNQRVGKQSCRVHHSMELRRLRPIIAQDFVDAFQITAAYCHWIATTPLDRIERYRDLIQELSA